jgi:V8-like Glu-specific endopeptidase
METDTAPQFGPRQLSFLQALDLVQPDTIYAHPSEALTPIANMRMVSLLAFAAFAAQWPRDDYFHRLRGVGVHAFNNVPAERSALLVLIGLGDDTPADDVSADEFLADGRLRVRDRQGAEIDFGAFEVLPPFPVAAQRGLELQPGPIVAELMLPGFGNTLYALTALPGRVTVLVVAVEATGEVMVQQYLFALPARPGLETSDPYEAGKSLRWIEVAQSYYTNLQTVPDELAMRELLWGKWLDPLLGCLAGYSLIRAGKAEYYGGPGGGHAMKNMLNAYPELPDSHVLAGLCQPARRAEHYSRALTHGLPIFAEGFRALHTWYTAQGETLPQQLAQPSRGLLPASPWTAWTVSRPVLRIAEGHFARAPFTWEILEEKRSEIERVLMSVGRIDAYQNGQRAMVGSCFVVAPNVIITASFVAKLFCEAQGDGWVIKPGFAPTVNFHEDPDAVPTADHAIVEVIDVHPTADIALLKLAPTQLEALPEPLSLLSVPDEELVGRRVYVAGYPAYDARADAGVIKQLFENIWQVKRLQPGEILGVPATEGRFSHDCFTLGGNAGSCVVDVITNRVLGLHLGGRYLPEQQAKANFALALWTLRNDPLLAA